MKYLLIILPLFVFSCTASSNSEIITPRPEPTQTQAVSIDNPAMNATEAQRMLNAAGAQLTATVQRQMAVEATEGARSEIQFRETQAVAATKFSGTQEAISILNTEQSRDKTQSAQVAIVQATATEQRIAIENIQSAEWGETTRNAITMIVVGLVVVICIVSFIAFVSLRMSLDLEKQKQIDKHDFEMQKKKDDHELELTKNKLRILIDGLRETNAGTFIPTLIGNEIGYLTLPPASAVENSNIVSDLPNTPKIIINTMNGKSKEVMALTSQELEAYDDMLEWINLSIGWHNDHKCNGSREKKLKRYNHIGKDPNWQVRVAGYFGDAISTSKAGSWAADGSDLGTLRSCVMSGKIHPCIYSVKQTVTLDNTVLSEVVE